MSPDRPVDARELADLFESLASADDLTDDEALDRIAPFVAGRWRGVAPVLHLRPGLTLVHLEDVVPRARAARPGREPVVLSALAARVAERPLVGTVLPSGRIGVRSAAGARDPLRTETASLKRAEAALGGSIAQFFFDLANGLKRKRRNRRFERGFREGRPVVVAEGDSWVLYPWKLRDVAEHLADAVNVWSVGAAGDELVDMVERGEHLDAIRSVSDRWRRPDALLFSGGGNDILGPPLRQLVVPYTGGSAPGVDPERFLRLDCSAGGYCVGRALDDLSAYYDRLFDDMAATFPDVTVYVHGYDYAEPGGHGEPADALPLNWLFGYGDWLSGVFEDKGIHEEEDQDGVVRVLIDAYNERVGALAAARAARGERVEYVDVRGAVGADWANEIHPNTEGFGRVAARVGDAILPGPV